MKKHPLEIWAIENGWLIPTIARKVRCSEWHLRNIIQGRKKPSLDVASRLSAATNGEVSTDDFVR